MTIRYASDLDIACRDCHATYAATELHVCPAARAALLQHVAADNADEPKDWCDKHRGYVDEGRSQPMATGSPYRICDGCAAEAKQRISAHEGYCTKCTYLGAFHLNGRCPAEHEARAAAGDR